MTRGPRGGRERAGRRSAGPLRSVAAFATLAGALVLVPAPAASACTCAPLPLGDPLDLAGRHAPFFDAAFIGSVERVEETVRAGRQGADRYGPGRYRPVVVDVEVPIVGEVPERAILVQRGLGPPNGIGADCSFGFVAGGRYLVEAHRNPDGTFLTDGCTFTQTYGEALQQPRPTSEETADSGGGPLVPVLLLLVVLGGAGALVLWLTLRPTRTKPVTQPPPDQGPAAGGQSEPPDVSGPPEPPAFPPPEPPAFPPPEPPASPPAPPAAPS